MGEDMNDFKDKDESGVKYSFNIAYNATKENKKVHEDFKAYAKREADDSYLQAIKRLLELDDFSWKFDSLNKAMLILNDRIAALEEKANTTESSKEEKSESTGLKTFGGE